jgi:RNA polymerase sigma factor (TIGR02999 family)
VKALPGETTRLLAEVKRGNKDALGKLMPLVYTELRHLAGHYLRAERIGHTLQPTALVHEAYLRLVGQDRADWQNRAHFMGVAAQLMRRILVDYARRRLAGKRGGIAVKVDLDGVDLGAGTPKLEEILAVDEALRRLSELDPQQGRVVELRYFAGLTVEETAEALGISTRTVKRDWAVAEAWLRCELSGKGAT